MNLKSIIQSARSQTQRLHTVWFIYDIPEKAKLQRQKSDQQMPTVRGRRMGLITKGHQGIWVVMEIFYILIVVVITNCLYLSKLRPVHLKRFIFLYVNYTSLNPQKRRQIFHFLNIIYRASLVAQWLRICLPMQGTRVRALYLEDPTCRGATRPVRHNYWACALEPASHNYWARVLQLLKPKYLEPVLRNKRSHRNEQPAHHN